MTQPTRLAEILLIEDNEGDIELARDAFEEGKFRNTLHIARDGDEALDFLLQRNGFEQNIKPDIIMLDLNLPKTSGREVLQTIKQTEQLKNIPVIILTSSHHEHDILDSYGLQQHCYLIKPIETFAFIAAVQQIDLFSFDIGVAI